MTIKIRKNIMKSNRENGHKQYTISIPDVIRQLLQTEQNKKLYIIKGETPQTYIISTTNPKQPEQYKRSIFPNGQLHYFTLPVKLLKDMKDEQINHATFKVRLDHVDEYANNIGQITLNIN